MKSKLVAVAVSAAFAISLLGATSASAATEAGNRCGANASDGGFFFLSLANGPGNPLPAGIPSSGVITRWSFSVALPFPPGIALTESLKVLRPTGAPNQFQVVGESSPQTVSSGSQTFSTRISVRAGDLIGAVAAAEGSTGTVFCKTDVPGDRAAVIPGSASTGSIVTSSEEVEGVQNPIVVFVEPDADNDGFGDETQDQCPQNAAVQVACPVIPVVALSTSAVAKKGLMTVLITSSTQAPVTVTGTAKLGKGKTAKLNGGTQIVAPGTIARFTLLFPQKLKNKLKQLSPKQRLTVNVVATAVNSAGQPSTRALKVKLKGQAKPKKPRRQAKS
jgi:hypothetical protein